MFSPVDLTTGLLGTDPLDPVGYQPAYAAVARNAVLWAAARAARGR